MCINNKNRLFFNIQRQQLLQIEVIINNKQTEMILIINRVRIKMKLFKVRREIILMNKINKIFNKNNQMHN